MHSKILKYKVFVKLLYVLFFSIFFSSYLFANDSLQESIEQGKKKSQVCIACHGVDGNSINPQWPSIAQQSKSYIVNQLKYFRDGKMIDELYSRKFHNWLNPTKILENLRAVSEYTEVASRLADFELTMKRLTKQNEKFRYIIIYVIGYKTIFYICW